MSLLKPPGAWLVSKPPPPREIPPKSIGETPLELSVVMPCLNEGETLASCIKKAHHACGGHGITYEIIVADNGSTDGSQAIAESEGARVVPVPDRGYGMALT